MSDGQQYTDSAQDRRVLAPRPFSIPTISMFKVGASLRLGRLPTRYRQCMKRPPFTGMFAPVT
jgi:hypothetical protein